jgi:transglutaminase-like putative cysteine protease
VDCSVTHATRFQYTAPVRESVVEVRLAARNDAGQHLQRFDLRTSPAAAIFTYVDSFGNLVHHFDVVAPHRELVAESQMRVRTAPPRALPEALDRSAWDGLDRLRGEGRLWDFLEPSPRVPLSPAVEAFAAGCGLRRDSDPLTCIRRIVSAVHRGLAYVPESTTVDTPVDTVLETRRGVCQDFSHVALAIARGYGIPCRYVSGYLAPSNQHQAAQSLTSHAWIEAWLPGLEWTALDPTHDVYAADHHIAVAVGRDYGDAAPTRGVFRGGPARSLIVTVRIEQDDEPVATGEMVFDATQPQSTVPAAAAVHAGQ